MCSVKLKEWMLVQYSTSISVVLSDSTSASLMDLVFVGFLPSLFSFFCPFHFLVEEELDFPKSEGSLAGSINILSPAEFLKLNPLALIPILVDGDFVLAESLAIIMYLDDKYPQYPLLPHDVPKRALNFQSFLLLGFLIILSTLHRLHILFCRITSLRKKVGPHEKLPWAQSVIRKGFTALEKLLKDHAGRYATGDEIFLCKITWRILIGVAVENVIRQPILEVSSTVFLKIWSCLVNNAGIGLGDKYPIGSKVQAVWSEDRSACIFVAAPLGMNKEMNTDTIVKAKSFLDGDEDQHEKDVFEKNLKALQKIF
ncbi:Glutathione S-transferase [Arachis hypogaea]|nr:Glutathione S-transferase [Arachis hypogaea]